MRLLLFPAALAGAVLLAACGSADVTLSGGGDGVPRPPSDPAYISGEVAGVAPTTPVTEGCVSESDLDPNAPVSSDDPPVCNPDPTTHGTVHVVRSDGGGGEPEASVTVPESAPVVREGAGGELQPVPFSDLEEGDVVSVWITGQVLESFPVQVSATYVLVDPR